MALQVAPVAADPRAVQAAPEAVAAEAAVRFAASVGLYPVWAALAGAGCHALLGPATPGVAFALGARRDDPLQMYLEDAYTVGPSLAGLPAITLPAAMAEVDGTELPAGVQLIGRAFDESTLLRAARALEAALDFRPTAPESAS